MQQLTQEYLDSCSRSDGFIMRGENMTRIETFVDAAFAFAMTMLIISVDEIPNSAESLFVSLRDIPAFLASAANIGLIWYWHSTFSRRFGLQDSRTTMLSFALVMLMLIFIYPLKLVFMGLFAWLSSGYLSPGLETMHIDELSNLRVCATEIEVRYLTKGYKTKPRTVLLLDALSRIENIDLQTLGRLEYRIDEDDSWKPMVDCLDAAIEKPRAKSLYGPLLLR